MSAVTLFNDITTEAALQAIEADSASYVGLYVDMNEAKGRKYVKEQAANIGDILKRLDRARIDKAKDYKSQIEKEAAAIKFRLEEANKPFTLLIDEYTAERKKVLDAENARKKAIEDQAAIDGDYEIAVLMMDKYFSDKAKEEAARLEHEENLRREGARQVQESALLAAEQEKAASIEREQRAKFEAEQAEIRHANQEAAAKQAAIDAEARRIADIEAEKQRAINEQMEKECLAEKARIKAASDAEHVASVHRSIKAVYVAAGFPGDLAEKAVKLLVARKIPNTDFNY